MPVLVGLGVSSLRKGERVETALRGQARPVTGVGARLRHAAGLLAAVGLVALAVVWASYGFRYALSPDPGVRAAQRAALEPPVDGP